MISSGELVRSANHSGPLHHRCTCHTCTTATEVCRILSRRYVTPLGVWMTLNLLHVICDELTIFTLVTQPV